MNKDYAIKVACPWCQTCLGVKRNASTTQWKYSDITTKYAVTVLCFVLIYW